MLVRLTRHTLPFLPPLLRPNIQGSTKLSQRSRAAAVALALLRLGRLSGVHQLLQRSCRLVQSQAMLHLRVRHSSAWLAVSAKPHSLRVYFFRDSAAHMWSDGPLLCIQPTAAPLLVLRKRPGTIHAPSARISVVPSVLMQGNDCRDVKRNKDMYEYRQLDVTAHHVPVIPCLLKGANAGQSCAGHSDSSSARTISRA